MKSKSIRYVTGWSVRYLKQYRLDFLVLLLLTFLLIVLSLFQINTVQRFIDAVLGGNRGHITAAFLAFAAAALAMMLRNTLFESFSGRLEAKAVCSIRNRLLRHLLAVRMDQAESIPAGELLSRYDGDAARISGFFCSGPLHLLLNPLLSICGFLYLFQYSPLLSLGVFLPVPLFAVSLNALSARAGRIYENQRGIQTRYTQTACDIVQGAETIAANQMEGVMLQKMEGILKKLLQVRKRYTKNVCLSLSLIMSVTYVPGIISLLFGGILALRGDISVSLLFAYSQLIGQINAPIVDLFSSLNDLREAEKSMRRLDDLFTLSPERTDGRAGIADSRFPVVCSRMCFSGILNRISFRVTSGECIGITGESGVGKTTLFRLICGLLEPTSGSLLLFGRDIREWKLSDLRRSIACVFQENQIFPGTVQENIRLSLPTASLSEIRLAARLAGLDPFIQQLPDRYDTLLSGEADEWSGGQYQRLNLARAFLQEARLYLFDEPSASLDPEMEKLLLDSILLLRQKGRTVLIVSHRPALLLACDKTFLLSRNGLKEIRRTQKEVTL